jgi:hypothetical protein
MDKNSTRARRLVCINLIAAVLVGITFIASATLESFLLILGIPGLVVGLAGLGVVNIIAAFGLWKNDRQRALIPLATYICCIVGIIAGTRYGVSMVLAGTPQRPDTFPRGKSKEELEQIATQLLGHSFKSISIRPGKEFVRMVDGTPPANIPADLLRRLRSYGFDRIFVDDTQSLVVLSSYHHRTWYDYLYTTAGTLEPAYSRPSTITGVDIESWTELSKIARQGPKASGDARSQIVFEPGVVYPILRRALGEDALNALAKANDPEITPEQKGLVLKALNDQRLASSRLIEDPRITYGDEGRFHLSLGCWISDSFWVTKLLQTLMHDGVIRTAEDNRHLRIKENLTPREERQVEWLHVGMMDFLYGNLLQKHDHHYGRDLGHGWYFERN